MTLGQLILEQDRTVSHALVRGAALPRLLSVDRPVALYGAVLRDDALVLGRYQLPSHALGTPHAREVVLRRATGGATVRAGSGIFYLALALRDRSSLMKCPPGRLLNRNVRGVLQGLRLAGVRANYFGRDFLSFGAQPAVYVGWDAQPEGQVLCEFFVAQTRTCFVPESELAYPQRREPTLRGQAPITLAGVDNVERATQLGALFDRIAEGHAKTFGVRWEGMPADALTPHQQALGSGTDTPEQRALSWSTPREEAIGFVSAGVRLDGAGKFAAVQVAGDFFAHRACAATLERVLIGVSPTPDLVARAVDAAFAHAGYDVEGIRSLRTFQDAIIDAADAASRDGAESQSP
ncbi:MAG: hypothetical protein ABW321_00280 [Polyangiales bacterium]